MRKASRRKFLKQSGASVVGIAALDWNSLATAGPAASVPDIPSHRSLLVPGVHAYADGESVGAGQTISFHVSSTESYRLSVCRLGLTVDDPASDQVLHEFPEAKPKIQPIFPGSYVHVKKGIAGKLRQLTLECWVRPWHMTETVGLITQLGVVDGDNFSLHLNGDGSLSFGFPLNAKIGHSASDSTPPNLVQLRRWHHVVSVWDGKEQAVWLNGMQVWSQRFDRDLYLHGSPIALGAASGDAFLDGDLAMPVIYRRALGAREIREGFAQQGLVPAKGKDVLACWPFTEERGDRVADISGYGRHGRIINHATWMIGGPSFQAEVPRYGDYDPANDPRRGHGLRFASDDLYDCRWEVTHNYRVPSSAKPGIYVGRIRYERDGKPHLYHVTFIVRKAPRRKKAPVLVLCATNTWRAYSATPFAAATPQLKQVWGTGGTTNSPGNPPAYCFYRGHAAGQGTYQLGLRMPWPAAGPYILYGGKTDYSHLCRADRFLHVWLEQAGYDFDVISDLDLHREPEILRGYRVFAINGHSEYWSLPMYRGLEKYLASGGNVICLSGNSLFWRVTYNEAGTILECRKVDAPGDQLPGERRGECWHSHDGQRGGLLRECGHPGWKLIGLETLGWNNQDNPQQFGPYLVDQSDHFLFNHPHAVGVKNGDAIGQAPDAALPRANGHEIDVRLSTLADLQQQTTPAGATLPKDPPSITRLANGIITWKIGGAAFDYFFRPVKPKTDKGGEMIYWKRPEGGRVFNAGSIGAGWGLLADAKFQRLLKNVLFHFGVSS